MATKKYSCDICANVFTQSKALNVHTKSVHGNIKNYVCEICNFAFRSLCFDHLGINSLSQKQSSLLVFVCAYSSSLFTITIRTQSLYAIEKDRKQNNLSSAANQMVLLICTALAAAGKHTTLCTLKTQQGSVGVLQGFVYI